jgi:hypothetical protein
LALVPFVALSLLVSCPAKGKLPEDPGLASDGLGIGLRLGMTAEEARSAADEAQGKTEIWVITREELNQRSPYAERPQDKDLLVALYTPFPLEAPSREDATAYDRIAEIRCYLADPRLSHVTLLRSPVAKLTPEGAVELLGTPAGELVDSDGSTHLSFEFALPLGASENGHWKSVQLTTSHGPEDTCFALKMVLDG